jgi:DEAD/DEAH box helicase domain-containing protein
MKAKSPRYGTLKVDLQPAISRGLAKRGIQLYSHQTEAINHLKNGENVVITTGTGSGKTLCYNIPVFDEIVKDPRITALYLFPTKALSRDQLKAIWVLEAATGINTLAGCYDGDTPLEEKRKIRIRSSIIISNCYGMHVYLQYHWLWQRFFENLRYIVIDEAHQYRGVFGSNVAFLLRRIQRVCETYKSNPQFVVVSATIANPAEFAQKLTGREHKVVDDDGSAQNEKTFLFWNPPRMEGTHSRRKSTHAETRDLLVQHVTHGFQTICFAISRRMAELISRWTKKNLEKDQPVLARRITSYRAGYRPEDRRVIEHLLKKGHLSAVVSTNALEVGIDIGSLDSAILAGFPGTIIATSQQMGRAGHGTTVEDALVTLVAFDNPLDQYYMRNPNYFFDRPHEHCTIDLTNPYILRNHIICAASEKAIGEADKKYFGPLLPQITETLREEAVLRELRGRYIWAGEGSPQQQTNLNNISNQVYKVIDTSGELLGTVDHTRVFSELHEGAIYHHMGDSYLVEKLNTEIQQARVSRQTVNYYTEPRKHIELSIKRKTTSKVLNDTQISLGEVKVTEEVIGYVKKEEGSETIVSGHTITLPPTSFETVAVWLEIPHHLVDLIQQEELDFLGGLHAIEHAIIAMAPIHALCDRWDIGGVSHEKHPDLNQPTIFVYDACVGGIGLAEKNYELMEQLLIATLDLISECECLAGCPSCIYSPKCGNNNEPLNKRAAIILLQEILNR